MRIEFCTNDDVGEVTGCVVVIDVLRAFTTAAVALAAGAAPYELVADADAARSRQPHDDAVRFLGEVDGVPPEWFDYSNSPSHLQGEDLRGVSIVHRSSAGTQAVVRATAASRVLVSSFAVAGATVTAIRDESDVTFCITGLRADRDGEEDRACGEYLAALLESGAPVDPAPFVGRVVTSTAAGLFDGRHPDQPPADVPFAQVVDRFDFAMEVRSPDGRHFLEQIDVPDRL